MLHHGSMKYEISAKEYISQSESRTGDKKLSVQLYGTVWLNSQSHHYAQLGNALQKHFFAYFASIMDTLKGFTGQIFKFFCAQSQNFTGSSTGSDLT